MGAFDLALDKRAEGVDTEDMNDIKTTKEARERIARNSASLKASGSKSYGEHFVKTTKFAPKTVFAQGRAHALNG